MSHRTKKKVNVFIIFHSSERYIARGNALRNYLGGDGGGHYSLGGTLFTSELCPAGHYSWGGGGGGGHYSLPQRHGILPTTSATQRRTWHRGPR